jgi:hypothetical protein
MRKRFKMFMVVGLGAVLSLTGFPFHPVLTGDRGISGSTGSPLGLFFTVNTAIAGGICLNYDAQKMNAATTYCRDTMCSSECSSQASCVANCKLGCNRFAEKAPSGPWVSGQCHLDEDQATATELACETKCSADSPNPVSNIDYCKRGCYSFNFGLLQGKGL